jgi:hypothetical protein
MHRALLVYDGSRRPFRAVADAVAATADGLRPVPWESAPIQAFLEAQFDGRPFAFVLIEGDRVHVGSETLFRVLRRRGVAAPVARAVKRLYPVAAGPFGRVVHGQAPADIDGTFPLADAARAHVDPLRRAYDVPVEEA